MADGRLDESIQALRGLDREQFGEADRRLLDEALSAAIQIRTPPQAEAARAPARRPARAASPRPPPSAGRRTRWRASTASWTRGTTRDRPRRPVARSPPAPDPAAKTAGPDTPARDAPAAEVETAFGRVLGQMERPQARGQKAADEAAKDATIEEAIAPPTVPAPVLDPQAALRALIVAAQEPVAAPVQTPPPAPAAAPPGADVVAMAERAAGGVPLPVAMPAERPKVAVLAQETHFAPVLPDRPPAAEPMAGRRPMAAPALAEPAPVAPVANPTDHKPTPGPAHAERPARRRAGSAGGGHARAPDPERRTGSPGLRQAGP